MSIIVTGSSKGVGKEITRKLLQDTQHRVIGISRSSNSETDELKAEYGARFHQISFDLSDTNGIKELYFNELKPLGPIYGLVNNAAMAYDDLITNVSMERLLEMYQLNVFAAIHLTKYAIRDMMLHRTHGSIVFISSVSAHTAYKGLSMYASSKGAIEAFSKGLAREWGGAGIRSNCVVPGFMDTSMSASLTEEQKQRIYNRTALKAETSLESVAETVTFLLSDRARSITGQNIHVDSGTI
ncbi:SDR family NAD(P)-dependent oxidoreductase [Paenibacillus sp. SYP-B4298]|uniref:SDR family NAD(P)-dependent oxidoreductase n=1 Tax=Paenibacillus sp. SYP-B4298 TaxID=2996034 RepID=UPI0022DD23AA|nr:SDR family oxidoreductase [Paenibacillus sp. SYP-B4298]